MDRKKFADVLRQMNLYLLFTLFFLIGIWAFIHDKQDYYQYFSTIITLLSRIAVIGVCLAVITILEAILEMIISGEQLIAVVVHVLFTGIISGAIGLYFSALRFLYL